MRVNERIQQFIEFEENEKLFERKIDGIDYWQLIREEIFLKIIDVEIGISMRHPDLENAQSGKSAILGGLRIIPNLFNEKFNGNDMDGAIVFCTSRRTAESTITILLHHYKGKVFLIDRPYKYMHLPLDDSVNKMITDRLDLERGLKIKICQLFPSGYKSIIENEIMELLPKIVRRFHTQISLKWIVNRVIHKIQTLKVVTKYYRKVFNKYKPKAIVMNNRGEAFSLALISVAHEFQIPVIEILHGYTNSHPAYSYAKEHDRYLPNWTIVFGEYWKDMAVFPDKSRLIPCGSIEVERNQCRYANRNNKNYVTFISQGPFADVIYSLAVKFVDYLQEKNMLNEYQVVYKLHPSEISTWSSLHPTWNDNRLVFIGSEVSVYQLMQESIVFVGINSTAMFECIAFNTLACFIDCKYTTDDMVRFCQMGYGNLISSEEDVFSLVEKKDEKVLSDKKIDYIWKNNALNNAIYAIDNIVNVTAS